MKRRDFLKFLGIGAVAPNFTWKATPKQKQVKSLLPKIVSCTITTTYDMERLFDLGTLIPYDYEIDKAEIIAKIEYENGTEESWKCNEAIWTTENNANLDKNTPCIIINHKFYWGDFQEVGKITDLFLELKLTEKLT